MTLISSGSGELSSIKWSEASNTTRTKELREPFFFCPTPRPAGPFRKPVCRGVEDAPLTFKEPTGYTQVTGFSTRRPTPNAFHFTANFHLHTLTCFANDVVVWQQQRLGAIFAVGEPDDDRTTSWILVLIPSPTHNQTSVFGGTGANSSG